MIFLYYKIGWKRFSLVSNSFHRNGSQEEEVVRSSAKKYLPLHQKSHVRGLIDWKS